MKTTAPRWSRTPLRVGGGVDPYRRQRWMVALLVAVGAVIAGAAFTASFAVQYDWILGHGFGRLKATIVPLVIDVAIVVSAGFRVRSKMADARRVLPIATWVTFTALSVTMNGLATPSMLNPGASIFAVLIISLIPPLSLAAVTELLMGEVERLVESHVQRKSLDDFEMSLLERYVVTYLAEDEARSVADDDLAVLVAHRLDLSHRTAQRFVATVQGEMLDGDGEVYFVQAEESKRIKIGYAGGVRGVEGRVSALRTSSPEPLRVLVAVPGSMTYERVLHERFSAARHHGEWFNATKMLVEFIEALQSEHGYSDVDVLSRSRRKSQQPRPIGRSGTREAETQADATDGAVVAPTADDETAAVVRRYLDGETGRTVDDTALVRLVESECQVSRATAYRRLKPLRQELAASNGHVAA